jgi:drug/metabolite transporter (DMT)-like permease
MGLVSALLAALFIAGSNLFMRRSLDSGGTTKVFLVIQMAVACAIAFLMGPVKNGSYSINLPIAMIGLLTGVFLALMLYVLGRALEKGPPGLTFSILSSASVMPGIVMAVLFGAAFGFSYTIWHALGSALVLVGLFWAGKGLQGMQDWKGWVTLVSFLFALHVAILVIYQWRAMTLHFPSSLITSEEASSQWFMPMLYLGATAIQLGIFFRSGLRKPLVKEWLYGFAAGSFNCLCTFFLLQATELAKGMETAVIFPLFSIGTILFSNLWGQHLYQERVNWRACQVCSCGIIIGTVDWKAIASALGF